MSLLDALAGEGYRDPNEIWIARRADGRLRPDQFVIDVPGGADFLSNHSLVYNQGAKIGVDFHGPATLGSTGAVTEGNSVYDCFNAFYSDTGSARDVVVRNNYYSNIGLAVRFDFNPAAGGGVSDTFDATSLERDDTDHKIAIFTSGIPHGMREGDAVRVIGALVGGQSADDTYNGDFTVRFVLSDTVFTYSMKNTPEGDADPPTEGVPIQFQARWQIRRLVYEGNICELYPYDATSPAAPSGVGTIAFTSRPPFMFPSTVCRENFFRLRDNAIAQTSAGQNDARAFRVQSYQNALIEGSVIELPDAHVLHYLNSQNVRAFNNVTPRGETIPIFEHLGGNQFRRDEGLEDRIKDALISALI